MSKHKRIKLIRLVIQLSDCKHNREVMDELFINAKSKSVVAPHCSIKREDTQLVELLSVNPPMTKKS